MTVPRLHGAKFLPVIALFSFLGCVPYGTGYQDQYDGTGDLTCLGIAECADEDGYEHLEDCLARGNPEAADLYQELDDCFSACGDDEACTQQCAGLEAECICGPDQVIDDRTGDCTHIRNLEWLIALVEADVIGFCGLDGVGADEFFHIVALDGVDAHASGLSDCYEDRFAQWPASATWPYSGGRVFDVDIWEEDVFSDDLLIENMAYDGSGNLSPFPNNVLIAGASTGSPQDVGALVFVVDYR